MLPMSPPCPRHLLLLAHAQNQMAASMELLPCPAAHGFKGWCIGRAPLWGGGALPPQDPQPLVPHKARVAVTEGCVNPAETPSACSRRPQQRHGSSRGSHFSSDTRQQMGIKSRGGEDNEGKCEADTCIFVFCRGGRSDSSQRRRARLTTAAQ